MKHNLHPLLTFLLCILCLYIYPKRVELRVKNKDEWRKVAFKWVYDTQLWRGKEENQHIPLSGPGSTLESTGALRELLPAIVTITGAESMLDAGCGDFTWMQKTPLPLKKYIGADIVESVIQTNKEKYEHGIYSFECLDVAKDTIPKVDIILCRDCLAHLSFADITKAVRNFKKSRSTYLLASTFPKVKANITDIDSGNFRAVNLRAYPFNFPTPIMLFQEVTAEHDMKKIGKYMALWKLEDIEV